MRFGYDETCLGHDPGARHPETPDRLVAIRRALQETHTAEMHRPPSAGPSDVEAVHAATYVAEIDQLCASGGGRLDPDTVASERTWDAALASAGLAMWAAEEAAPATDPTQIPFALGRPPGHHAVVDAAMGFCIFNNVAIAAQRALDTDAAASVAIIDWDVHHGNGTQDIFEARRDVLYVSIHEEGLYPGTGAIDEVGTGPGEGGTLNIPLIAGAETATYQAVMDDIVHPWILRGAPDLLLVSAGFDAHRHDPISRMAVSTDGFGVLTAQIVEMAAALGSRVGFVLEGGYGLDTLSDGVRMVHDVCEGYEPVPPDGELRSDDLDRIRSIQTRHGLGSK